MTTNPKNSHGAGKVPLWLVPPVSIVHTAWALASGTDLQAMASTPRPPAGPGTDGGGGYPPYSWRSGGARASVYGSAVQRHMLNWLHGGNLDIKSGVHELGHVMANCAILLDAMQCGSYIEDRPGVESELSALMTHKGYFGE